MDLALAAEVPKWQAEWQKIVEAAKKEGQVSLYGGQEITHPDILAAFNKEFPFIKVLTTSGRGGDLLARIISERRADKYFVNVIATGPNGPRMLYLAKALDPIAPALILPEVTDVSKWYGGKHWYADPENQYIFMFEGTLNSTALSYNTKLMNPDEIKSYWDLLRPKWKGKLLTLDPRGAAPPTTLLNLYHKPGLGADFVRRFYSEMEITLFRDRRQGTNWLATGKFPLCFLCRDIDKANRQGLPVDVILPDRIKEWRNVRRRQCQQFSADQSSAASQCGQGFHKLVPIPTGPNGLAKGDEYQRIGSFGVDAQRHCQGRRVARGSTCRGQRVSSCRLSGPGAGAKIVAGDFEVRGKFTTKSAKFTKEEYRKRNFRNRGAK